MLILFMRERGSKGEISRVVMLFEYHVLLLVCRAKQDALSPL